MRQVAESTPGNMSKLWDRVKHKTEQYKRVDFWFIYHKKMVNTDVQVIYYKKRRRGDIY